MTAAGWTALRLSTLQDHRSAVGSGPGIGCHVGARTAPALARSLRRVDQRSAVHPVAGSTAIGPNRRVPVRDTQAVPGLLGDRSPCTSPIVDPAPLGSSEVAGGEIKALEAEIQGMLGRGFA
jgi:hypothetical protein